MLAIVNAKIFDGTGNVIENGQIIIENGAFVKIGTSLSIPNDYKIIDVGGNIVTPGLIDVHTHLGVHEEGIGKAGQDVNETSSEVTAQIRSLDGINPFEPGFEVARKSGITTVQIMPGSANVIGGEMVVVKTVGTIVDQMVLREPSGMKAATGENPKNVHGGKGVVNPIALGLKAEAIIQMKIQNGMLLDYVKSSSKRSIIKNSMKMVKSHAILVWKIFAKY